MKKPFNIDSNAENADWIKRGRLDTGKVHSVTDVLRLLRMDLSPDELDEESIKNIQKFNWYENIPVHIKRHFSQILENIQAKKQKKQIDEAKIF